MNNIKLFLISLILLSGFLSWSKVDGDTESETEELTYEDLLIELKSHKSSIQKDTHHPYDDLLIHAGLGFVSTFSTISIGGQTQSWQQNGLELAVGADLFSQQWYTEGTFRNYGIANHQLKELSVRQLDFKIGYRDHISNPWFYNLGAGLSTRALKYNDFSQSISAEETSPAFLGFIGVEAEISPSVSFGFEMGGRSPFVSSSLDHGSFELGFILGLSI